MVYVVLEGGERPEHVKIEEFNTLVEHVYIMKIEEEEEVKVVGEWNA